MPEPTPTGGPGLDPPPEDSIPLPKKLGKGSIYCRGYRAGWSEGGRKYEENLKDLVHAIEVLGVQDSVRKELFSKNRPEFDRYLKPPPPSP